MNTMTFKIKWLIVSVMAVFVYSSCSDALNAPPQGTLNNQTLNTPDGIRSTLNGSYASLYHIRPELNYYVWGDVAGGLAHQGSNSGSAQPIDEFEMHNITPDIFYMTGKWTYRYEGISRANAALNIIEEAVNAGNISQDQADAYSGEARFLRGFYYFDLQRTFGSVPWIDETTQDHKQPNEPQWANIEADFQYAADNLPEIAEGLGGPNNWVAKAFLGKTYLYQQKYQEANAEFEDVIASGVNPAGTPFELTDSFHANFNAETEHNSEYMFDVQNEVDQSDNNHNGGIRLRPYPSGHPIQGWGFFQPTYNFVNSFRVDANGHPLLSGYPSDGTWNSDPISHDRNYASNDNGFTQDGGPVDPRLDWTVIRRGLPMHDWGPFAGEVYVREMNHGSSYYNQKIVYWRDQLDGDGNVAHSNRPHQNAINYKFMRFADVLLMHAETEVEMVAEGLGGSLAEALDDVNAIRERAGDGITSHGFPETVQNEFNEGFADAIVDNEADMLEVTGSAYQTWVVRTDQNSTYLYVGGGAGDPANWFEYTIPTYDVQPYTSADFSSPEEARKRVHFERKLELGLEGHWFHDLVRWGEAEDYLGAYYDYEGGEIGHPVAQQGSFEPHEYLFPIPSRQIELTMEDGEPTLEQNCGYSGASC